MKQIIFYRCFTTEDKVLMGSDCGQPQNAHPTAKINKDKNLALIF